MRGPPLTPSNPGDRLMFQAITSTSDKYDPLDAVNEVVADCISQLSGALPNAGILLTSYIDTDYTEMLAAVCEAFPETQLVGCTTDGEISNTMGVTEDSVTLLLFISDTVRFATALVTDISTQPDEAFREAFARCSDLLRGEQVCGFIFPDGLTTIGIPLDTLIRETFGEQFPFFGGTAGDHYLLKQTHQFYNNQVHTNAAPILLMGGELDVAVRMVSGWSPIGKYHSVEKFENNRVFTIDGMSARQFYEKYLGPYQQKFTDFPLAVYAEEDGDFILRTLLSVDDDGSGEFIGNFFDGAKVRLTTILRDDAIAAADMANKELLEVSAGRASVILAFSCAVRRHFLSSRREEESVRLRKHSPVPYAGFYSYGEIGPMKLGSPTRFHTNTYIVVSLMAREQ